MKLYKLLGHLEKEQYIAIWDEKGRLYYSGTVNDLYPREYWGNKFIKLQSDRNSDTLHLFIKGSKDNEQL